MLGVAGLAKPGRRNHTREHGDELTMPREARIRLRDTNVCTAPDSEKPNTQITGTRLPGPPSNPH